MRLRSIGLAAAPVMAVVFGWFVLVVLPASSAATDLDRRLTGADGESATLLASVNESRQLERSLPMLQAELERLALALPSEADLAGVVRLVDQVADATGVSVSLVSPRASDAEAPTDGEPLAANDSFQVEVAAGATYAELLAFIEALESADRFVSITDLGLVGGQDSGPLEVTMIFEVFTSADGVVAAASSGAPVSNVEVQANPGDAGATLEAE